MVTLDEQTVTLVVCVLRQWERTVATGLHVPWREVRAFYAGENGRILDRVAGAVLRIRGAPVVDDPTRVRWQTRADACRWPNAQLLLTRYRSRRSGYCRLASREFFFLAYVLEILVGRLGSEAPLHWDLIQLRDDLATCQLVLERHFGGIPPVAYQVEDLSYTAGAGPFPDGKARYRIKEIVPGREKLDFRSSVEGN